MDTYNFLPRKMSYHYLPKHVASERHCLDRWLRQSTCGFRYTRAAACESPRMQRRIEELFQLTHQRPIGSTRAIPLGFARGFLAEKRGYAINWVRSAENHCRRGKAPEDPFVSFQVLKECCVEGNGFWPENEVPLDRAEDLEGADNDWEVNVPFRWEVVPIDLENA